MVSHKRSTTLSREAKTSLRKPRLRISFQTCSIGFISGVYGGIWNRTILSGNSNPADLCHAAPSQQRRIISSLYFSDSCFKKTHTGSIAIRHDKKVPITRQRFHCSVGVTILTNMVAGHTGTDPFPAPAVSWLVDPAKSGFILEHKADFPGVVDKLKFLYCGVNFFEAAISSSLAFLGCLLRGITFRHPCRCRTK